MIRKNKVLELPPVGPQEDGQMITAQSVGEVLILNCYQDRKLLGRYCMDLDTHRYLFWAYDTGAWTERRLMAVFGYNPLYFSRYYAEEKLRIDTEVDKEIKRRLLGDAGMKMGIIRAVITNEEEINDRKREQRKDSKIQRLIEEMSMIPPFPSDLKEWIYQRMGGEDYLLKARGGKKRWICTNCAKECMEAQLTELEESKELGRCLVFCPNCGKQVWMTNKKRVIRKQDQCMLLQNMDKNRSAARYIDVRIIWDQDGRRTELSEGVRIILHRTYRKNPCRTYYSQTNKRVWNGMPQFDYTNWANRRIEESYLYPEGISGALSGTPYCSWIRAFEEAAKEGLHLDFNKAMIGAGDREIARTCEYLLKGRFFRLAGECISRISWITGKYDGILDKYGKTMEEVFMIADRQKIHRIRGMDGGETVVEWMRISEKEGKKISQAFLRWVCENDLRPQYLKSAAGTMTPEQIMNYVKRQKTESYEGSTDKEVLEQWADYLSMCAVLEKDMSDAMVYRPRELKRRHGEAVEALGKKREMEAAAYNKERAERMAREMRRKYPGAEENLEEVREKFEYENEHYCIVVPKRLAEISEEGYALHHCAGSSERYFERIMRHETYICFLRRQQEPDVPYYTIEVEPGGTIRQHRSFYDEEPGIENIREFLKEWQREIRRRMKKEDYRKARISRRLREDNIKRLQKEDNTRVLQGLMEDFMEAL